jgi:pilus assembly protein CpaE
MEKTILFILGSADDDSWATEITGILNDATPLIVHGSPLQAASQLSEANISPAYVVVDIGLRGNDILPEIDALAQHCDASTRVVAVGTTNDINLYRDLLSRGVADYLPMPASAQEVVALLSHRPEAIAAASAATPPSASRNGRVIACFGAGSGDGASMVALNTAYAISGIMPGNTVLVDMDYQFGMVAKQIDLQAAFGIRELFDNPDRGVDATLLKRMVVKYGALDVISAPAELGFLPSLGADTMKDLINVLRQNYDTIVIDLPHVWLPWVATVTQEADKLVLVAQLWLKSVAHAARLMKAWRDLGIHNDKINVVINRAGAKFKEAVEESDFERVCGTSISHHLTNDIRIIGEAEGQAKTVMELQPGELSRGLDKLARDLVGLSAEEGVISAHMPATGLLSMFKKRTGS